ncbi:hypothetical protein C0Z18_02280 [Trinickia dabaoshanensis]|uniref:Uncharacterized protein n=1 Tax=Trinickia dabaoshanensis TaxID=564714 RepID=A0A2N7W0Z2_9BURK|nr:hypothetical protein [Trinickia dabaoshanensis]PMS23067.1 hypothetical protein C0Z18_02280 [Trinickia dabaoshanensis]
MLAYVLSKVRQAGYQWLAFADEPLYLLFEKMYRYDPRPFPNVTPHPTEPGFLLADFTHPQLAPYRGREIAFFNARHAVVYWLPGAGHSGTGYAIDGMHTVTMGGHALMRPLRLCVVKEAGRTAIRSVAPQLQPSRSMPGCRIAFRILGAELHELALRWLTAVSDRPGRLPGDGAFRDVLAAARALTGFNDLVALADALQSRLDRRMASPANEEGLTDAGSDPRKQRV